MVRVMDQGLDDKDVKKLVEVLGVQPDGTIVLSPDIILNKDGKQVNIHKKL